MPDSFGPTMALKLILELSDRNSYEEYRSAVRELAETALGVVRELAETPAPPLPEVDDLVPGERATQLYDSWINGNRKDVMTAIGKMWPMRAAAVVAYMVHAMDSDDRGGHRTGDFIRMIERRLEE